MFYVIITYYSLVWFLLSLITDMLIAYAIVTPKWLIGASPQLLKQQLQHTVVSHLNDTGSKKEFTTIALTRYPSVGIYSRCKLLSNGQDFHCGDFDLDGFATDNNIYPAFWKAAMFFICFGFFILSTTVMLTLITCCRQSAFGKSLHNLTACFQVMGGISVMLALFLHAFGWGSRRVQLLCGLDAEPFNPGECSFGSSFYSAIIGLFLAFACAGISLKAESSNMRNRVKSRVEEGDRLVCIP